MKTDSMNTEVAQWAERNAIYPESAAKLAFEDAISTDYAKQHNHAILQREKAQLLKSLRWINAIISTAKDGGEAWVALREQPGASKWAAEMRELCAHFPVSPQQ